jgi:hypothetical protein
MQRNWQQGTNDNTRVPCCQFLCFVHLLLSFVPCCQFLCIVHLLLSFVPCCQFLWIVHLLLSFVPCCQFLWIVKQNIHNTKCVGHTIHKWTLLQTTGQHYTQINPPTNNWTTLYTNEPSYKQLDNTIHKWTPLQTTGQHYTQMSPFVHIVVQLFVGWFIYA